MRRIRMTVQMPEGAARNGERWPNRGETAELPTAEAAHLVASGVAEDASEDAAEGEGQLLVEPRARRRRTAEAEGEG
ncbi:hypothetical protein OQI_20395 [Streptomyces pharetrae CZA14]|uniref:Uncharacterized protein n=1 Tax=Streptomyces pharetrae CZA14 TaxID=1144883 RepID=A0ABX3YIE7_9ACTN|nr:hypothetical protein OQI_20395 [Streptomyces pharetrae CZA14]